MSEYLPSHPELAILSLIAEHPRHGYELEQVIQERGMRSWTGIAFSSIYFLLTRLVKNGMASFSTQPATGRGPSKKVFIATPQGHSVLHDSILRSLETVEPGGQSLLLGLSCLPLLQDEEIVRVLQKRILLLEKKIQGISATMASIEGGIPKHVSAMFEVSLVQLITELDWAKQFLSPYQKGA
ncbi:MAG: PadR family transcriptional regulator [Chloroflexi bacterium]|nr:PadR family transcriptional regulator [Chloroflexota bacterium]